LKSKLGYFFGGFLVFFAGMVAWLAVATASSTMQGMQRVQMPGRATITLPIGPSAFYAEGADRVQCNAVGLALRAPAEEVSYSLAGYHGKKVYDVDVAAGGRYELECSGEKPFAIAIGAGVGAWGVIAWLSLIPAVIGVALAIATYVRRSRSAARPQT
jgi:hypothetical protein